jgi:hypothetical protein
MTDFELQGNIPVQGAMGPEMPEAGIADQANDLANQPLSRRWLLVGGGLVALMAACGDDDPAARPSVSPTGTPFESAGPEYGEGTTLAPDYTPSPYQSSSSATPTPAESGSATPAPSAVETTPDRPKAEIVGHELKLDWTDKTDAKLAAAIRKNGLPVDADPSMEGLDESYFNTAVVIGLPVKSAKGRKLGVAVVSTSPDESYGDVVYKAKLPTGVAKQGGKTVAQRPAAVSSESGQVYPYRFRRGSSELTVVFYTTDSKGKNAKVVDPVVINPKVNVNNGTYSNAHVI